MSNPQRPSQLDTKKPVFIVLEGADGTGKTTVAKELARTLGAVYLTTPPEEFGGIRSVVDRTASVEVRFLYYLMGVVRVSDHVRLALGDGRSVVCDRYVASTIGYHRVLGLSFELDHTKLPIVRPDLTFQLTLRDEAIRVQRLTSRQNPTDADNVFRLPDKAEALERQYAEFRFPKIETDRRTPAEVVGTILEAIGKVETPATREVCELI